VENKRNFWYALTTIKTEVFFLCFLEKAKNKIKQVLRESSPRLWRPMIPVVE
jgi:hypothetical protein